MSVTVFFLENAFEYVVCRMAAILFRRSGGCFTNLSQTLQNNLAKIHNARSHIYDENFKLKLCMCAQSMALGIRHTKFQLEILIGSTIFAIHKFRENILESTQNVSETTPGLNEMSLMGYYSHEVDLICIPEVNNLQHLVTLDLMYNRIQHIAKDIKNCTNLTRLLLDRNNLQWLPRQLCQLSHLEELSVAGNQLLCLPLGEFFFL